MKGTALDAGASANCTRPVITSVICSGIDLYGTCTALRPARFTKSSAEKCVALPMPAEENVTWPGLALTIEMRSLTLFTFRPGLTTRTAGTLTVVVMPAKSFAVSYGSFVYMAGATACEADTESSV
jgi:hypothetical protein